MESLYTISATNEYWPLKLMLHAGRPVPEKLILLCGPERAPGESTLVAKFLARGYRLIGLGALANFPGRSVNPWGGEQETGFDVWRTYAGHIAGWLYGMRDPWRVLPEGLPRLELAHSDFTCPERIAPGMHDGRPLPRRKRFDAIYICRPGASNRFYRNWPLAARCISRLVERGYRVRVIGPESGARFPDSSLVSVRGALGWHGLLAEVAQSRCLLVPNVYDASPRILGEAMCLDVPILVNYHIVAGWKYVNKFTGRWFHGEHDVVDRLADILDSDLIMPRRHFCEHYGPRNAGRRLYDFVLRLAAADARRAGA